MLLSGAKIVLKPPTQPLSSPEMSSCVRAHTFPRIVYVSAHVDTPQMCTYTERSPCRGDFVLSRVNKLLHDPITDSSLYNGWMSAEY